MNGNNIFISLGTDTAPIAGTRSDSIKTKNKLIEVSSPTTGQWEVYIAGRSRWSFTVGWLLSAGGDLAKLLTVGTTYTINIYRRAADGATTKRLTGTAICEECNIQSNRGNLVQGSFTFCGTGALEEPST